jgi:hypothetical protein
MSYYLAIFLGTLIGFAEQPETSTPKDPHSQTLQRTNDPSKVAISQLHTVFERKSGRARVSQILLLNTVDNSIFSTPKGYAISLPNGASNAGTMSKEDATIEVLSDRVRVKNPIGPQGIQVSYIFELPINQGTVWLEQKFKGPIATSQAVTMWTRGDVEIRGDGFGEAALHTPQSGVQGLAIVGQNLDGNPLRITVSGLEDGPEAMRRVLTFALCVIFLGAGLGVWVKRAIGGKPDEKIEAGTTEG